MQMIRFLIQSNAQLHTLKRCQREYGPFLNTSQAFTLPWVACWTRASGITV
ncbi:hypothetical protein VULLAG_LOCUS12573 [Vulpes lagopus]